MGGFRMVKFKKYFPFAGSGVSEGNLTAHKILTDLQDQRIEIQFDNEDLPDNVIRVLTLPRFVMVVNNVKYQLCVIR